MLQQAGLGRLLTLLGCQQLQKTLGLQLSSCGLGFPLLWGRVGVTKEPGSSRAMCCAPLALGSSNLLLKLAPCPAGSRQDEAGRF